MIMNILRALCCIGLSIDYRRNKQRYLDKLKCFEQSPKKNVNFEKLKLQNTKKLSTNTINLLKTYITHYRISDIVCLMK